MDREGIEQVVCINYIARDIFGFTDEVHDYVVELCKHAPDRLLPCGSVDPVYSSDLVRDAEDLLFKRKIRLLKVHGPHALFAPDDYLRDKPMLGKVYRMCEEYGVPIMIHTGTSVFPGARSKYGHPMVVDDIAIDFPELIIIMAHGGRPLWMAEAFFLLRRHENVYMDISGIPPKLLLNYFPRIEEIARQGAVRLRLAFAGHSGHGRQRERRESAAAQGRDQAKNPLRQRRPAVVYVLIFLNRKKPRHKKRAVVTALLE